MKIKEVCEKTGLTDRTIRYYIECGLLTPSNKQNYAGRKQFTFTREDVERLETIKTFRGAGFSVEQIKRLFQSRSSREVVQEHLRELEADRKKSERLYETLKKADMDREVSVEELAIIVASEPAQVVEEPSALPVAKPSLWERSSHVHIMLIGFVIIAMVETAVVVSGMSDWIPLQHQIIPLWIVLMLASYGLSEQRWWIKGVAAIAICAVMLMPTAVAVMIGEPRKLSEEGYALIQETPWTDEAFLSANGFERAEEDVWRFDSQADGLPTYWERSWLRVVVWDADSKDIRLTQNHKRYGKAYVSEYVDATYTNVFEKWLVSPYCVERRYSIIIDGYVVDVWETNYDDRRIHYFEEFLKELTV